MRDEQMGASLSEKQSAGTATSRSTPESDSPDSANTLLRMCKARLEGGPAIHHAFLIRFEDENLSLEQLRLFALHWYITARAHREAFPRLIASIKDEDLRFDLVEILREEYGMGHRDSIHAKLLQRLLVALGLSLNDVESTTELPAISCFGTMLSEVWGRGEPPIAIGLQLGLEYLASPMQGHFARGLEKYPYLSKFDREYFDLHSEAEVRHIGMSERGFLHFAANREFHDKLCRGVELAESSLHRVWDELHTLIFMGRTVVVNDWTSRELTKN